MRKIGIIGMPMDLGGNHRGVDMGPFAVRHAEVQRKLVRAGFTVRDFGNVNVPVREEQSSGSASARYLREITEASAELADLVHRVMTEGYLPVTVGGDHSLAIGSIAGVAAALEGSQDFGLLWLDAHGDLNTPETSPSGNIHGMPLAVALGRGPEELVNLKGISPKVNSADVALIGLRDLDDYEVDLLSSSDIAYYTMSEIDEHGMNAIMHDALRRVTRNYTIPFHLSFDLDVVDPRVAPGVGTPVLGGLTYRESHYACELIAETRLKDGRRAVCSMDLVEINPILDEKNKTAQLGVELLYSCFADRRLKRRPLEAIEHQRERFAKSPVTPG